MNIGDDLQVSAEHWISRFPELVPENVHGAAEAYFTNALGQTIRVYVTSHGAPEGMYYCATYDQETGHIDRSDITPRDVDVLWPGPAWSPT